MKSKPNFKARSLMRLGAALPVCLQIEWAMFLRVTLYFVLAVIAAWPLAVSVMSIGLGWVPVSKMLGVMGRGILVLSAATAVFSLLFHTASLSCFYFSKLWNLCQGRPWRAEDLRKLRCLAEATDREPIFPSWIYWQQLRFQVWYAGKRRSFLKQVCFIERASRKICP